MTDLSWIPFEKRWENQKACFAFLRLVARAKSLHDVFPTLQRYFGRRPYYSPACPACNRHDDAISKTLVVT